MYCVALTHDPPERPRLRGPRAPATSITFWLAPALRKAAAGAATAASEAARGRARPYACAGRPLHECRQPTPPREGRTALPHLGEAPILHAGRSSRRRAAMNKYEVLGVVGEGAYGIVLKCRNKASIKDEQKSLKKASSRRPVV